MRRHLLPPLADAAGRGRAGRRRPPHHHRALRRLCRGLAGRVRRAGNEADEAPPSPRPNATSGWHVSGARPTRPRSPGRARALAKRPPTARIHALDPTARSYLIDRLGPGGRRRRGARATPERRRRCLGPPGCHPVLGEFDEDRLPLSERERVGRPGSPDFTATTPTRESTRPRAGCSSHWGQQRGSPKPDLARSAKSRRGRRRWYVNAQGQTMVIVPPGQFRRGRGQHRVPNPGRSRVRICGAGGDRGRVPPLPPNFTQKRKLRPLR